MAATGQTGTSHEAAWVARFCAMIERQTGLVLSDSMAGRLPGVLQARAEALQAPTVDAYLRELERSASSRPMPEELQRLVNAFTVGKTSLFRYPEQIDLIVEVLVPSLDRVLPREQTLNIWSAACATGEEIYSIVMALQQAGWLGGEGRRRFFFMGTDINTDSLATAEAGRIDPVRMNPLPDRAASYCVQDGEALTVASAIRQNVTLQQANLNDERFPTPAGGWHVIVCANVLIYFSQPTTERVLAALHQALAPAGALMVGGAETAVLPFLTHAPGRSERPRLVGRRGAFAHLFGDWPQTVTPFLVGESLDPVDAGVGAQPGAAHAVPEGGVAGGPVPRPSSAVAGPSGVAARELRAGAPLCVPPVPPRSPGVETAGGVAAQVLVNAADRGSARAARASAASASPLPPHPHRVPAAGAQGERAQTESLQQQLDRAAALAAEGRRDDAIDLLQGLQEHAEASASARHSRLLALLLLLNGSFDDVPDACNAALAQDPLAFDLHFYLAFAHLKSGRATDGVEALRRALFLEPSFVLGRYQLAFALHEAGELDAAVREYRRVEREVEQGTVTRLESAPEADLVQSFWIADHDILVLCQSNRSLAEQGILPGC